ncbi:MAG: respiratory chain complex I subunit 1 family protein [Acidimicrobiales bacterium]
MTGAGLVADAGLVVTQVALVTLGGPLLIGVMRKVRARLEGRVGAPILQPLADLRKLLAKGRVHPRESSAVFAAAPAVLLATTLAAAAVAPLVSVRPAGSSSADFFAVVFVLLLGSVSLALGALDTGTAFAGMGASRSTTIAALAEPALFVAILALAIPAHTSNLPRLVLLGLDHPASLAGPAHLLALASLVVVIVAETGRLPVDNPATHLELTMIHEAMVLEYAGRDLALVSLGESARLALLLAILVNLATPWGVAVHPGAAWVVVGAAALAAKVGVVGAVIALVEVGLAKLRLFRLPELLVGGFLLALLGVISAAVVR